MVSNRSGQRTWRLVSFQGRMCKWLTYNLPHSSVLASSVFCPFPKRKQQDWGNDSVGEAFVTEYARTWIWVPSTHERPEVAAHDSVEQGKMEDWPRESQRLENPRVVVSSAGWRLTFKAVLWPPQRHKDLKRWKIMMAKPQSLFLWNVPSTNRLLLWDNRVARRALLVVDKPCSLETRCGLGLVAPLVGLSVSPFVSVSGPHKF